MTNLDFDTDNSKQHYYGFNENDYIE